MYQDDSTELDRIEEEKMANCRGLYQEAKFFIKKAFPGKPGIWNKFGFNNYDSARQVPERLIQFMALLHKTAEENKAALIAKNYTQPMIDALETAHDELQTAYTNHQAHIEGRPSLTNDRIDLLNTCYDFMEDVSEGGKIIFVDNYGKYIKYVMGLGEEDDNFHSTGAVPPNGFATTTPAQNMTANPLVRILNDSEEPTSNLLIGLVPDPAAAFVGTPVSLPVGELYDGNADGLGDINFGYIRIQNDTPFGGHYTLTIYNG